RLPAARLAALPPAIAKRILAERASAAGSSLEARHLDALLALCAGAHHGSAELHLPGLVVRREYGDLLLGKADDARGDDVLAQVADDGAPPDGPYTVRTWRPGDRMRPQTLRGHSRKLQDLLTDRKVPVASRRRAIVVVRVRDDEIVWAEHVGPA